MAVVMCDCGKRFKDHDPIILAGHHYMYYHKQLGERCPCCRNVQRIYANANVFVPVLNDKDVN